MRRPADPSDGRWMTHISMHWIEFTGHWLRYANRHVKQGTYFGQCPFDSIHRSTHPLTQMHTNLHEQDTSSSFHIDASLHMWTNRMTVSQSGRESNQHYTVQRRARSELNWLIATLKFSEPHEAGVPSLSKVLTFEAAGGIMHYWRWHFFLPQWCFLL